MSNVCVCVCAGLCACVSTMPLDAVWQKFLKGGLKGRFSLSLSVEGWPAEEREMDLLQMPPWAH